MNSNEIVLKHFSVNGKLYELVYTLDPKIKKNASPELQDQLDEAITQASYEAIKALKTDLESLTFEQCQTLMSKEVTPSETVKALDHKVSDLIKQVHLQVFNTAYPRKDNLFETFLDTWAESYLNKAQLEQLPTAQQKLAHLEQKIAALHSTLLTKVDKESLSKELITKFSKFLEHPEVIRVLTPELIGSCLRLIGLSFEQPLDNLYQILKKVHPTLRQNQKLLEHLKIFKTQDPLIDLSLLQSEPGEQLSERYKFLHRLESYLCHPLKPISTQSLITSDPSLQEPAPTFTRSPHLQQDNIAALIQPELGEFEDSTPIQEPLEILKQALKHNVDQGFRFTRNKQQIDDVEAFLTQLEDLPIQQQLEILTFLRPETLNHLKVTTLKDNTPCESTPIEFYFDLTLNQPGYKLELKALNFVYTKPTQTQGPTYHKWQASNLVVTRSNEVLSATVQQDSVKPTQAQQDGARLSYLLAH
jgi:hypothetical protein